MESIESHCLSLRRGTLHCDGEFLPHEEVLWKDFGVTAHGCSRIRVLLESDEAKDQRSLQQRIERVLLNRLLKYGETLLALT